MSAPHVCILQTSFAKRDDTIAFLKEKVPGVRVEFITDSTLLNDIRAAGGPTQAVIDRMTLYAFTGLDKVPAELRDGGFVPYAGSNAYCLSVFWESFDGQTARLTLLPSALPEEDFPAALSAFQEVLGQH